MRIPVAPVVSALDAVSVMEYGYYSRCVVTCHCTSSLHFPEPHVQGQKNSSKTEGTGAAVRRYLMSKGKGEALARL